MDWIDRLAPVNRAVLSVLGEGATVTYTPSAGAPVTVTGIFDNPYQLVEAGTSGVSESGPVVWLILTDLPSDPETDREATITYRGANYRFREVQKDGAGSVRIKLHEN